MADRSWYYASEGQQKGPFPENQFRDLIARGIVRADTLVWADGMAGWQKAGEVPGMISAAAPPVIPRSSAPMPSGGGYAGEGAMSVDLPLWGFLGWCLLLFIGNLLVIPAPWTATGYYRWLFPKVHVPGRPNLSFTGQVGDIWYVFIGLALLGAVGYFADSSIQLLAIPLQAFLSWMILRWAIRNISSNGEPLQLTFEGSVWVSIGWQVLSFLAIFTIIGWAWVMTAWMRWICRNIAGTRREIVFNGTGLQVLWRTLVFGFGCAFIIPIPWVARWYFSWFMRQFAVIERGMPAGA